MLLCCPDQFFLLIKLAMAAQQDLQTVFDQTDVLYTENKWKEAFDILSPYADNDPSDVELLWRLVRVFYRISKFFSKDKEEMVSLAKKGLELSKKALTIDDKHFQCQKVSEQLTGLMHVKEPLTFLGELDP